MVHHAHVRRIGGRHDDKPARSRTFDLHPAAVASTANSAYPVRAAKVTSINDLLERVMYTMVVELPAKRQPKSR
jgi:hypothetical protein